MIIISKLPAYPRWRRTRDKRFGYKVRYLHICGRTDQKHKCQHSGGSVLVCTSQNTFFVATCFLCKTFFLRHIFGAKRFLCQRVFLRNTFVEHQFVEHPFVEGTFVEHPFVKRTLIQHTFIVHPSVDHTSIRHTVVQRPLVQQTFVQHTPIQHTFVEHTFKQKTARAYNTQLQERSVLPHPCFACAQCEKAVASRCSSYPIFLPRANQVLAHYSPNQKYDQLTEILEGDEWGWRQLFCLLCHVASPPSATL